MAIAIRQAGAGVDSGCRRAAADGLPLAALRISRSCALRSPVCLTTRRRGSTVAQVCAQSASQRRLQTSSRPDGQNAAPLLFVFFVPFVSSWRCAGLLCELCGL